MWLVTVLSFFLLGFVQSVRFFGNGVDRLSTSEYILTLHPHVTPQHAFHEFHAQQMERHDYQYEHLTIGQWTAITAVLDRRQLSQYLNMDDSIIHIEPVRPSFISGSCHKRKSSNWGLERLNLRDAPKKYKEAYRYSSTADNVDVYVVDTGIAVQHPEFEGRARWGANFWDIYNYDCSGHGTHVAGIIGSKTYGVAKEVNLIAVKTHSCNGEGSTKTMIQGIRWAAEAHHNSSRPSIINISAGSQYSPSLNMAVEACIENGIIVVAAAGNAMSDACKFSPASSPSVITVASINNADQIDFDSNTGPCVDFFAPGYSIWSTWLKNETQLDSGTSMACPHVTGVAALLLGRHPNATVTEIEKMMNETATVGKVKDAEKKGSLNKIPNISC
ncbi:extracellular subtilisin-like serine proteinase [Planoprotostelium fungivorum]|uniref:Extracellular subtilisin-like serine proteinase n=1 Tax=Planoprotostelium fungivorum TaxID=1890364 RepID=A0A2P6NJF2_9EUKA|nr:extracellular subtilisin-like serine proteinase [Planoprotostelium fungivorum]